MLNVVEYLLNLSQVFEVIRILETLSFAADAVDNGGCPYPAEENPTQTKSNFETG